MAVKKKRKAPSMGSMLQKIINKAVKIINSMESIVSNTKWLIAKEIHTLNVSIPWKLTPYRSFKVFCGKELTCTYAQAIKYIVAYNLVINLGYSGKELNRLNKVFSFSALVKIFRALNGKKISVTALIKKYKHVKASPQQVIKGNKIVTFNAFTFILDDKHASILNKLLEDHGMVLSAKKMRMGASGAMATFLDTY